MRPTLSPPRPPAHAAQQHGQQPSPQRRPTVNRKPLERKPSLNWLSTAPQLLRRHSSRWSNNSNNKNNSKLPSNEAAPAPPVHRHASTTATATAFSRPTQQIRRPSRSLQNGVSHPGHTSTASRSRLSLNAADEPKQRHVYAAFLSSIAQELRQRMVLTDRIKRGIEFKNVFDGKDAVDKLASIIAMPDGRDVALRLGIALGAQRFFHDVNYENRLVDSASEIYQFHDDRVRPAYYIHGTHSSTSSSSADTYISAGTMTTTSTAASDDDDDDDGDELQHIPPSSVGAIGTPSTHIERDESDLLPNGVFTELTYCYVPTCIDKNPCYSYSCPKRERLRRQQEQEQSERSSLDVRLARSTTHAYLRQKSQQLWSEVVPAQIATSVSHAERKRQETIFELIYTEDNFVKDLEYVREMWIKPLELRDILPAHRREAFIRTVFSNIMAIHSISRQLLLALRARQKQHPVVYEIGDIVLDFVVQLEPFIQYGARQHEARYALDTERQQNRKFAQFAEQTERHPSSYRLELDGYLSKPTARLGRYTLILDAIHKYTAEDHPDYQNIPRATEIIRQFLTRVNAENGKAKNRFDLERIHNNLAFKHKADEKDLKLMEDGRQVLKQIVLRKTAHMDSTEYLLLLFDHCLVVTKIKYLHRRETYVVKRRPIPLELLKVTIPPPHNTRPRRSSSILPHLSNSTPRTSLQLPRPAPRRELKRAATVTITDVPQDGILDADKVAYPVTFEYLGRRGFGKFTLFASAMPMVKPLVDQIEKQQMIKAQRAPVIRLVPAIQNGRFLLEDKVNHIVTFNQGQQYVLATNSGVFVGHIGESSKPHKVLDLPRVTQVQVLESAQLLLVLADRILWEYDLVVVNGKPEEQPPGRKLQTHVPYFHVGQCLQRTLVCVPKVSPLTSTITLYEPSRPQEHKNKRLLSKFVRMPSSDVHLRRFKDCYIPSEAWAIELSRTQMLITCPRGVMMVDMRTDKPQQMLNPNDKSLAFVTDSEKHESSLNLRPPVKHISVFRIPLGDHFVCYDEYGFYIDGKGNRMCPNFLIEWEGSPESFAFSYPYAIAFDSSFIEVRNVVTGHLEQVIQGSHIRCINNGHKTEKPYIFGVMTDPERPTFQHTFQVQFVPHDTFPDPSTITISNIPSPSPTPAA